MLFCRVAVLKSLAKAGAHVRYIAFRSRERPENERGVFDAVSDHADVKKFIENLRDRSTSHPKANKAYKLIVSLSRQEWGKLINPDYKEIVRQAMARFESQRGVKLEWVAAEHLSKHHPHAHVVIKAVCYDENGHKHRFHLSFDDTKLLRSCFEVTVDRYRDHFRETAEKITRELTHLLITIKAPQPAPPRHKKLAMERTTGTGFSLLDAALGIDHDYEEER